MRRNVLTAAQLIELLKSLPPDHSIYVCVSDEMRPVYAVEKLTEEDWQEYDPINVGDYYLNAN